MLINVQLADGAPITQMDDADLVKSDGVLDNDNEHTTWVEYRLDGRIVHRSAHVTLKRMPGAQAQAGSFG